MINGTLLILITATVLFLIAICFTVYVSRYIYKLNGTGDKFLSFLLACMAVLLLFIIICMWVAFGGL